MYLLLFEVKPYTMFDIITSLLEALQYVIITRQEIAYSINKVCQFIHSPTLIHWQVVKQILRYLKDLFTSGLLLRQPLELNLCAYANAD